MSQKYGGTKERHQFTGYKLRENLEEHNPAGSMKFFDDLKRDHHTLQVSRVLLTLKMINSNANEIANNTPAY